MQTPNGLFDEMQHSLPDRWKMNDALTRNSSNGISAFNDGKTRSVLSNTIRKAQKRYSKEMRRKQGRFRPI